MQRRIITSSRLSSRNARLSSTSASTNDEQMPQSSQIDGYTEKLLKLIPIESIGVYTFVNGILSSIPNENILFLVIDWSIFVFVLFFNWKYLRLQDKLIEKKQLFLTSLALILWVASIGGPFERTFFINNFKLFTSISIALYIFAMPTLMFTKKEKA